MALSDPDFYAKALKRVKLLILVVGLSVSMALLAAKGLSYGGGFLIGAAASYLSFWRWEKVAEAIVTGRTPVGQPAWVLTIRILTLMAVGYVIIRFSGANQAAALAGLLTPAAAATLEIIYELIWNMK